MKSQKYSESSRALSPPTRRIISSVSDRLMRSEIDSLRRRKKHISDYAQKELKDRVEAVLQQIQASGD